MIITKTPLRISFFGGGSDLPEYYDNAPGMVLSTSIDTHMYITVNGSPKDRIKACYDEVEIVDHAKDIKHDRIRESLLYFGVDQHLEIASFCRMPTKGTGLGSSSTYTVGLCNALYQYSGRKYSKYELAETAFHIERNRCGDSVGKQDQYAAAFGGLNFIVFSSAGVQVTPLNISSYDLESLNKNLMFFYTGGERSANAILKEQASRYDDKKIKNTLSKISEMSISGATFLRGGKLSEFGALLNEAWVEKKKLSDSISNINIDEYYDIAMKSGALGGKLIGAGNGGFLMFYVPHSSQQRVRDALSALKEYKVLFDNNGSEVIFDDGKY
jgi:D-glycero-alpha-D-manno-heptose-7-phosphate kinase